MTTLIERLNEDGAALALEAASELARLQASVATRDTQIARLRSVVDAARKMPRWTPKGGAASTMHTYQIKACDTWELDNAIQVLDANEQTAEKSTNG